MTYQEQLDALKKELTAGVGECWGCGEWGTDKECPCQHISEYIDKAASLAFVEGKRVQWLKDSVAVDNNVRPEIELAEEQHVSDMKVLTQTMPFYPSVN